jgi:hypothetical protein
MYGRALQGYEKVLGHERMKTYIPALNTMQNVAGLYTLSGRASKAKRCQNILTVLAALAALMIALGARRCLMMIQLGNILFNETLVRYANHYGRHQPHCCSS